MANASDYKQFEQEYKLLCERYKLQYAVKRRQMVIVPKTAGRTIPASPSI